MKRRVCVISEMTALVTSQRVSITASTLAVHAVYTIEIFIIFTDIICSIISIQSFVRVEIGVFAYPVPFISSIVRAIKLSIIWLHDLLSTSKRILITAQISAVLCQYRWCIIGLKRVVTRVILGTRTAIRIRIRLWIIIFISILTPD